MFFQIDPANGLPIYEQVVRQLKFAVADELLQPGELAPSVREVARELAINPNTVAPVAAVAACRSRHESTVDRRNRL